MNSPAQDIKDILDASNAGLGSTFTTMELGLTFAIDLFVGEMPDSPDKCICIYDTGGYDPESGTERYEKPTVMVMVRGSRMGYVGGWALAQDVKDILHKLHNETWNETKYIGIWCTGDINHIGFDQSQRPKFTINFRIHRTA